MQLKICESQPNICILIRRFDLITRSSLEEAGTQFFRVLMSHAYDRFLDATSDRRIKTRKNWVPASSDEDLVMRSKRQNKV